jgi:hypothetical protein
MKNLLLLSYPKRFNHSLCNLYIVFSYYCVENPATNAFSYYSASSQPPSLPYQPSGYLDLNSEYRNAENSKEKKEIHEMYEGDIAD